MGWETSNRRQRLPKNWPHIRRAVLSRDGYRCTAATDGGRCTAHANQVDHVTAGDDHRLEALTSLCEPHHRAKSSSEGGRSVHKGARQGHRYQVNRPTEKHPGLT